MMRRQSFTLACLLIIVGQTTPLSAYAQTPDQKKFADKVEGRWCGPGEIVAGKYKGTKFKCDIAVTASGGAKSLTMDGTCRVGVFPKPIKATIDLSKRALKGQFFGDSPKDRLDINGGRVSGNTATLKIARDAIRGDVVFKLNGKNKLTSTVSVLAGVRNVRVINMDFEKCDAKK